MPLLTFASPSLRWANPTSSSLVLGQRARGDGDAPMPSGGSSPLSLGVDRDHVDRREDVMRVNEFKCVLAARSRPRLQIASDEGLFGRS
jgi:hypothetical protein